MNPSIEEELGVFREFPLEASACSLCGSRSQPFILRCFGRLQVLAIYLIIKFGKDGFLAKTRRLFLFLISIPLSIPLEAIINITNSNILNMKIFISLIGSIICLGLPIYLVAAYPNSFTPLAQVLFSVMLAGFSVWLGIALASKDASKEAAGKWLPAAETAVKQLITISFSIQRMRVVQKMACENQAAPPNKRMFEIQCKETSEKLATIRDMIDNAASTWEVFIANNCEKRQCDDIGRRVDSTRERLKEDIESDFPKTAPQCEQ